MSDTLQELSKRRERATQTKECLNVLDPRPRLKARRAVAIRKTGHDSGGGRRSSGRCLERVPTVV